MQVSPNSLFRFKSCSAVLGTTVLTVDFSLPLSPAVASISPCDTELRLNHFAGFHLAIILPFPNGLLSPSIASRNSPYSFAISPLLKDTEDIEFIDTTIQNNVCFMNYEFYHLMPLA